MQTKVVKKNLGGAEDLVMSRGVQKQIRGGKVVEVHGLNLPLPLDSIDELAKLDPTKFSYADVDGTQYKFDSSSAAGIPSIVAQGSWVEYVAPNIVKAATPSLFVRKGSFKTVNTVKSNNEVVLWPAEIGGDNTYWQYVLPIGPDGFTTPAGYKPTVAAGWLNRGDALIYSRITNLRVCVQDPPFNADPTGVLDSTKAFKDAFTFAKAIGATVVWAPAGHYKITDTIVVPEGCILEGDGIDYWDTYRPSPDRLLKRWDKGTHLVYTGTGPKVHSIKNISNVRPVKSVDNVAFPFTDFTNNDSFGGAPATPKLFSVGMIARSASQVRNLRLMPNFNGIDGYNDPTAMGLGDEWDVGFWSYDSCAARHVNCQVVGYWRIGGTLLTENDGSYTQVGNPESTIFDTWLTQGRRGLLVRNAAQIDAVSNTANSIKLKYTPSFTLSADMKFKISGSATVYTFTGYAVTGDTVELTGVSPGLPNNVALVRAANIGNNFSGTVFSNFKSCSLDHTSGKKSADFGIGEAGALEIDGYPCRNLKFHNFKAQTTFDRLNTLFGDCRDLKFSISEHENGAMIAYSLTETQGYTGNLRYSNSDVQDTTNRTAFTPRDCFIDYRQFPTRFSNEDFNIQNWREGTTRIRYFNGKPGVEFRDADGNMQMYNGTGKLVCRSAGSTGATDLWGNNISFNTTDDTPLPIMQLFAASKNATFYGNVSPAVDNTKSLGSASFRWSQVFAASGTINTSNGDLKAGVRDLSAAEKAVATELKKLVKVFKFTEAIAAKGEASARLHVGVIAQDVRDTFAKHGLDAGDYGIYVYEKWEARAEEAVVHPAVYTQDAKGNAVLVSPEYKEVVRPAREAGEQYGIRYEELLCFIIAAM